MSHDLKKVCLRLLATAGIAGVFMAAVWLGGRLTFSLAKGMIAKITSGEIGEGIGSLGLGFTGFFVSWIYLAAELSNRFLAKVWDSLEGLKRGPFDAGRSYRRDYKWMALAGPALFIFLFMEAYVPETEPNGTRLSSLIILKSPLCT